MRALRVLRERGEAISARVRDEVATLLGDGASPAGQVRAARHAQAALDEEGARAASRGSVPACAAGCSWCCHVHVEVTGPEILAVVAHLEDAWSGEAIAGLRDRLASQVRRVEGLSDEARWAARIPCALLGDDGRCQIYPVRPLRCRAFHSSSVEVCREAFAGGGEIGPAALPALDRAHDAVEDGYDRALAAAGLGEAPERLESGLYAALR